MGLVAGFLELSLGLAGEIVSMCLDELKLISDDSHFVEEHVIFLADKYRAFLLAQRYRDIKKEIPDSNYQTICIDLQPYNPFGDIACAGQSYREGEFFVGLGSRFHAESGKWH